MSEAYRQAGVDIAAGEDVVQRIKSHVARTKRPEVLGAFGGFGALCELPSGYQQPVLVSGTDGVGTKLLVAQQMQQHRGIGIDLVAMCVNDIATMGAEPLFFLDYFATGKLAPQVVEEVVAGVADGCVQAGCALIGGETAEMPGMYQPGHYDIAGFCVGVVEKQEIIDGSRISAGDLLIGFASSGLHSNGYSLARKVCRSLDWQKHYGMEISLGDALLTPTMIYVKLIQQLMKAADIRGLAHITGGGLQDNIIRIVPAGLGLRIDSNAWQMPAIFRLLQKEGDISPADMRQTFNCGIGLVVIVPAHQASILVSDFQGVVIGEVSEQAGVEWR